MPRKSGTKSSSRITKLNFEKEFYSDIWLNDMLYAVTVRCPAKQGIVTSINHPSLPDEYTLITARDIPGSNLIDTPEGKIPIFSEGNISYLGEPIALLVGPDEKKLQTLLSELVISVDNNSIQEYIEIKDETPEHLQAQTESVFEEHLFSNVIAHRKIQYGPLFKSKKDKEIDIFQDSTKIVENTYTFALDPPNYGECNGAICTWKDKNLIIYTPTQWLSDLRKVLCTALKLDAEDITVNKTKSFNRGSNNIWYNSIIACQVATASLVTKHPVKLVYNRQEQIQFLDSMQEINVKSKLGADDNGKLNALQVDFNIDAGFLNPFAQEIIDRLVIASSNVYKIQNVDINATISRSSNPSSSININLIDSASFFAMENQMNELAKICNITPVEIRLMNSIYNDTKKNSKQLFEIPILKYNEAIQGLAKLSDFNRKYASFHTTYQKIYNMIPVVEESVDLNEIEATLENEKHDLTEKIEEKIEGKTEQKKEEKKEENKNDYFDFTPLRGIGFACGYEGSAYLGSKMNTSDQYIELIVEENRDICIHCPPVSPSIKDIWTNLVVENLQIEPSQVKFDSNYNLGDEPPLPESFYSNVSIMTSLLNKCCKAIPKQMEKETLPFSVKRKIASTEKKLWDSENFTGRPFHAVSFGCCTLELEVNPNTFKEQIKNITIVINAGKIMNEKSAINSIKLTTQKVLRSLVNHQNLTYEKLKIIFVQTKEEPTQISELLYQIIPPAYTQALTQAIGSVVTSLPLHHDSIYKIQQGDK